MARYVFALAAMALVALAAGGLPGLFEAHLVWAVDFVADSLQAPPARCRWAPPPRAWLVTKTKCTRGASALQGPWLRSQASSKSPSLRECRRQRGELMGGEARAAGAGSSRSTHSPGGSTTHDGCARAATRRERLAAERYAISLGIASYRDPPLAVTLSLLVLRVGKTAICRSWHRAACHRLAPPPCLGTHPPHPDMHHKHPTHSEFE
jgi:hypothetical protein